MPREQIAEAFLAALPHAKDLGLALVSSRRGLPPRCRCPGTKGLVGDPSTGVIHGGAVSALIDTTCGAAVMSHPENGGDTATLNLRIDYMRAGPGPGRVLVARATCYHVTRNVAFVPRRGSRRRRGDGLSPRRRRPSPSRGRERV